MIQATELRIGNYLFHEGDIYRIFSSIDRYGVDLDSEILDRHIALVSYQNLHPIPLTPEILEACGFTNEYEHKWSHGLVEIIGRMPHFKTGYLLLNGEERTNWACNYFYLHQLQNLYYALTGKELTYNPKL